MFVDSINLYNKRIKHINNIYKRVQLYKGNKRVIIVLLIYKEIKTFINRNLIFLKQNFHHKLFHRNIKYNVIDISNTFYRFPYKFNSKQNVTNFKKRGKWNYQHMCRFFFRDVFLHPSLYDVDTFMRLDSESILNTTVNLFEYMNKNIVYMHNRVFNDAAYVVKELKEYTQSLVKALHIKIKDKEKYRNIFKYTVSSYYNNFEICRMSFFRSKELFQFSSLVDLS